MKVSFPCIPYCYEWCCCIFLRFLLWENTSYQAISKENMGRFYWSIWCHYGCCIYGTYQLVTHDALECKLFRFKTDFILLLFYLLELALIDHLCGSDNLFPIVDLMMFFCFIMISPLFVQFAKILGRSQWLICPRKVQHSWSSAIK